MQRIPRVKDENSREPFLFIVGSGRSGTTLLRAMFDSHPNLAVPPESHFLPKLARERHRYELSTHFALDEFLADLFVNHRFKNWGMEEEDLSAALEETSPSTYPDAIRALYTCYAQMKGKRRYGDKTPGYVRNLPVLARLFPEARFIHIIRDGRNVALSLLEIDWGPNDLTRAALRWQKYVRKGLEDGRALGPERYREVRYEELVAEPESTVRDLCAFIDLEFDAGMLRFFERTQDLAGPKARSRPNPAFSMPPTPGLRDWRRQMTAEQVQAVEGVAGDLLESLGYGRTGSE